MMYTFTCNLCGARVNSVAFEELEREKGLCSECGANVRVRSIIQIVSTEMLGKPVEVTRWPELKTFTVIGVGDMDAVKRSFSEKLTYYDAHLDEGELPFLKVTEAPAELRNRADVLVCSEVLQHVFPPVQDAFHWLFSLLRPGGLLVLTVPYGFEPTVEYFPNLREWSLVQYRGSTVLQNVTERGRKERFKELRLYGNGRLESRLFGLTDLRRHLREAAFEDITIAGADHLQYGIQFRDPWSLPITARKP